MGKHVKRTLSLLIILQFVLSLFVFNLSVQGANASRMLKTSGNKIVFADDPNTIVRLTGLNVPGGEWTGTPGVERLKRSVTEAMTNWNSNLIRLPVSVEGWYGTYSYVTDGGRSYRNYIDEVIQMISEAGKYVVLDLHHYKSFNNVLYLDFWKAAAVKYANNPTVLFGILNEPHSVSWSVWRNGNGNDITGHQQVVEIIRDLGAKNIIVAGGLDWAYDLRGIAGKASGDPTIYALIDQGSNGNLSKAGNGIIYDTHIYPWKGRTSSWHNAVGEVRKRYPILVGENGWDAADILSISGKTYYPGDPMYHDQWVPELFAWMNDEATYGNLANWTGWCFHPNSSPRILGDKDNWKNDATYSYPPTDYWGVYVKAQLAIDEATQYTTAKQVQSIAVSDQKTKYYIGDAFDDTTGKLTITYSDNTYKELALNGPGVTISGFNSTTAAASLPITVNYENASTTYNIRVVPITVTGPGNPDESTISNRYVDIDFEDAAYYVNGGVTDNTIISTTNHASGMKINFFTYPSGTSTERYMIYTNDTETTYISPKDRKKNVAYELPMPSVITEANHLVYVDFKVKRLSTNEDPSSICFVDNEGNKLFTIKFPGGKIPTLIADKTYGTETAIDGDTIVNYPSGIGWRAVRVIIDFSRKTFELYQGESFENMDSFVSGHNTFPFQNTSATGLAKMTNYNTGTDRKGSLGFDDIAVYSVAASLEPIASQVKINGKLNIGAVLTGTYQLSNADVASSQFQWETALDPEFTNPTVVAAATEQYTITAADSGKYIRFTVIPKSEDGESGAAVSAVTEYPVDFYRAVLSIQGNLTNQMQFDLRDTVNPYFGQVDVVSTKTQPISGTIVAVWFENSILKNTVIKTFTIPSASDQETGIITQSIPTEIIKEIGQNESTDNMTMKVFLWEDLWDLVPIMDPVLAGVNN